MKKEKPLPYHKYGIGDRVTGFNNHFGDHFTGVVRDMYLSGQGTSYKTWVYSIKTHEKFYDSNKSRRVNYVINCTSDRMTLLKRKKKTTSLRI